eukprot:Gb_21843 [translate_table: standard]
MATAQPFTNPKKKNMVFLFQHMFAIQGRTNTSSAVKTEVANGNGNANGNNTTSSPGNVRTPCKQGQLKEALEVLHFMNPPGIPVNPSNYASLLHGCANKKTLTEGKLVHAHIIQSGFEWEDIFLGNTLVNMYAKCSNLADARRVLDQMPKRNVVSWTVMIAAYAKHGYGEEALTLFDQMQRSGIQPNQFTFAGVVLACPSLAALEKVHEEITKSGFQSNVFVGNVLVDMYVKCGSIDHARHVFDKMPHPDVVSWNTMIAGYAQNGHVDEAMKLFQNMPERDVISWTAMIAGYAQNGHVDEALKLFQKMPKRDVVAWNTMIAGYAENGQLDKALKLFQKMPEQNVVSWNTLIAGYARHGHVDEALRLFHKMPIRDIVSWTAMIAGYAENGQVDEALKLFQKMPKRDVVAWNVMIQVYTQNGRVDEALKLFQKMPERDVVSWNAMIAGYLGNGQVDQALKLFQKMPERNIVSWNTMISGYARNGNVIEALKLFQKIPKRDVVSWNAMIAAFAHNGHVDKALKLFQKMPEKDTISWNSMVAGYAQNGQVNEALKLFQKMPDRDVVSWNAIISGYAQNGHGEEALKLYRQKRVAGVKPNSETFAIILSACAHLAALEQGTVVHKDIIRSGFNSDVFVGSALVDMYAKCGSIEDASKVFEEMPKRDVVSWNAMIIGYAMHGWGKEALQLFEQMQRSGTIPDYVTFVGVLSACCHAGFVDDGQLYFHCMIQYYHITPSMEHYCCMVDLLGRAGRLNEAQDFINKMPIKPDAAVWVSLLGACRIHNKVELGECVARHLFEFDPENTAAYALLSNIYAGAGRWNDIEKVQKMMKDRHVIKNPGCSWIGVNNQVYVFHAGGEVTSTSPRNLCKVGEFVWADEGNTVCVQHEGCAE